ncbi:hypothetical protein PhCBS80983_g03738 [Powellomyces hirtus]|uniref:Clathrin light chain n=1 Tax=Powellomyces hirtus TaxID=109895 RepID=A0A507E150_9FUNG|nr:hypothetical protein PhCBS80983_g03738 [Powellomyces hirtus]
MSEFGDFVTTDHANSPGGFGATDDPTADFLAREQAILGADAALFGNDFNAGTPVAAPVPDSGFGGFGGGFEAGVFDGPVSSTSAFNQSGFGEAAFPSDLNVAAAVPLPFEHTGASADSIDARREPEPEPEVIREWRDRFAALVAERDTRSKQKHEEILANAKDAIERFYAEYNEKKTKSINRNKEQEKRSIAERDDTTSGTVWDRVVKQIEQVTQPNSTTSTKGKVDLTKGRLTDDKGKEKKEIKPTAKTRDTARMKQLLMSLRKDPKAPGVEASA